MQTKKISGLPAPLASPRPLPKLETGGGRLFTSELDRASGGDGVEAHREQREASEVRRTRQASRADANDQTRAKARASRQGGDRKRKERREQGLDASEAAAAVQGEAPQVRPKAQPVKELSEGGRLKAAAPKAATEAESEGMDLAKLNQEGAASLPEGLGAATLMAAGLGLGQGATPSVQRAEATNTQPIKITPTRTAGADTPETGTHARGDKTSERSAAGPKATRKGASDAMGELLLEREAKLDRQAKVLSQVQAQLGPGSREISLALSPASLGAIQLRLALRSGRLTAVLRASERDSLDALENQLPELTASLEAQGFDVVDFDLGLMGDPSLVR